MKQYTLQHPGNRLAPNVAVRRKFRITNFQNTERGECSVTEFVPFFDGGFDRFNSKVRGIVDPSR
ncbi:MAG: hypothetical protein LBQ54_10370 [Planctomycetaceae bacterium]|nr:hypothetical protein [Planctomycetaceae bacterium]